MNDDTQGIDIDVESELAAMTQIAKALGPLDPIARKRVMAWVRAKFEGGPGSGPSTRDDGPGEGDASGDVEMPGTIAELTAAADPQTDVDRALVGGYWVQEKVNDGTGFVAFDVNKSLKDLGYPIGNITDAISGLMDQRPALVIQTAKRGKSRQARKTYKVTQAGLKRVAQMVKNGPGR